MLGDSDTSLLLSLKHPLPSVRVSAVEHLMSVITSGQVCSSPVGAYHRRFSCFYFESRVSPRQQKSLDEDFLKDAVLDRVKDDVPEVVGGCSESPGGQ